MLAPGDARAGIACPAQTSARALRPLRAKVRLGERVCSRSLVRAGRTAEQICLAHVPAADARAQEVTHPRLAEYVLERVSHDCPSFPDRRVCVSPGAYPWPRPPHGVLQAGKASHPPLGRKAREGYRQARQRRQRRSPCATSWSARCGFASGRASASFRKALFTRE